MRAELLLGIAASCVVLACGTNAPRPVQTTDCSQDGSYSLPPGKMWQTFEKETAGQSTPESAFDTQDGTTSNPPPTRSHLVEVITEPDADGNLQPSPRCGTSKQALELIADGFNDWGTTFPLALASFSAYDASGTDGIALWMKATDVTRSFTMTLADGHSFDQTNTDCHGSPEAGTDSQDPSMLPVCPPGVPAATAQCFIPFNLRCSEYEYITEITSDWVLYKIPYAAFTQPLNAANRYSTIDPSQLFMLGFRIPKAAHLDLWVDDIGFYKSK